MPATTRTTAPPLERLDSPEDLFSAVTRDAILEKDAARERWKEAYARYMKAQELEQDMPYETATQWETAANIAGSAESAAENILMDAINSLRSDDPPNERDHHAADDGLMWAGVMHKGVVWATVLGYGNPDSTALVRIDLGRVLSLD
jgi:hypothetical protein